MTSTSATSSVSIERSSLVADYPVLASITDEVRSAIGTIDAEPSRGLKRLFPAMWCEYASIVLAEVLESRGLGTWTFVDAGLHGQPNGHAWLELRNQSGQRVWTIDATLDQFSWGGEIPFIGEAQTPAAKTFSRIRFEGNWRSWPVLNHNPTYRAYLAAFAEHSGLL